MTKGVLCMQMGLQLFMPAFLFDALYIMHVGLAPPLTVWISITFMEVSGIGNDAAAALAAGAPAGTDYLLIGRVDRVL